MARFPNLRLGVLAATGALAAALLAWAVVTPGYRGPDEPQHVSTALRLATGGGYPDPGTPRTDAGVRGSYQALGFPGIEGGIGGRVAPKPTETVPSTGSLRRAGGRYPDATAIDQMTQHPPAYYGLLAAVTRLFGLDDAGANTMLLVLRLASALLLLPIPLLIAATIRRVGLPEHAQLLGAFVPAAWIQFAHIGATVNNGSLLALAASAYVYGLVRFATGDTSIPTALITGVALGVALLTKGFALSLVPLAPFVYLAMRRREPVGVREFAAFTVPTLLGLGWWVRNVIVFGTLQPSGEARLPRVGEGQSLFDWAPRFLHDLSASTWVNLGWLETPLAPAVLHIGASLVALALVAYGTFRLRRDVPLVVVLNGAWLLPLAVFAAGSARIWLDDGNIRAAQGRYLQAAVVPIAVLLAAAVARWRVASRLAPLVAALSVAAGLAFGLRHFWIPSTPSSPAAMWPAGGALLAVAAVLLVASTAIGVIAAVRDA